MLTMLNLVNRGARIIMSRILLDVDFNDQTTTNHALNSDWHECNALNIDMANFTFEQVRSGDYCLFQNAGSNNYSRRGFSYNPIRPYPLTDYEIEFDKYQFRSNGVFFYVREKFLIFGESNNSCGIQFLSDDSIQYFSCSNIHNTWYSWKLHREENVLTIYCDNALVFTYDDTDDQTVISNALCFGAFDYVTSGNFNYKINNLKLTELKVKPYIVASNEYINAGDTVTLAVNGDIQSQKWSYNNLETQSIVIQPQSTITISCTVITDDNEKITLYKTINVSASVVYGRGAVDDDTLFLLNFANGKMNLIRGTCISKGSIEDSVYTEIAEFEGVKCLACNQKTGFPKYLPFFDSDGIWYNESKPIDLTFEYTIYTPNGDDDRYWYDFSFFQSILNTSKNSGTESKINSGFLNLSCPQSTRGWTAGAIAYGNTGYYFLHTLSIDDAPVQMLPNIAKNIIGNGWSDYGWHHICFELHLVAINQNQDECSVKMYVDGVPIKTWHNIFNTDAIARTGEWFTLLNNTNAGYQWYLSEMIITKGIKYGGMFKLPSNFYKQYTTIATEVLPVQPTSKFNDLAVVNANGTDAPVMAIIIESESLTTPICFAQSYHDFSARDHNQELRDFVASGIQINLPERNNQSGNALSFGVASVNGEVIELSNQVLDGAYPAYLTVLEYLPFDTSQEFDSDTAFSPIYSLTLFVTSCQVTTKGATITAGWHDTLNAKFPFKRYTAKQFKGLRYVC